VSVIGLHRLSAGRVPSAQWALKSDVSREFGPGALAVSQARRFLWQALQDLLGEGDGSELADTLLLVVNELSTNAVLHARTGFVVRFAVDAVQARAQVTDANSRVPRPGLAPADATSGRGLAIIDGSGLQHGIHRHPGGKTVWLQAQRGSDDNHD